MSHPKRFRPVFWPAMSLLLAACAAMFTLTATPASASPSRVVEVMFERILEATGLPPLPASFDLAKVRYWMPAIDQELRLSL